MGDVELPPIICIVHPPVTRPWGKVLQSAPLCCSENASFVDDNNGTHMHMS